MKSAILIVHMIMCCQILVSSSSQEGQLIKVSEGCFCPGSAVTYECTVNGGSGNAETTIWKGSVFSYLCPDFNNHALLFHGRYGLPGGTRVVCNDGAIVARSVSMSSNGVYTSQLLITLTLEVIEKGYSVECDHDDGENITAVGSLNITSGSLLEQGSFDSSYNISWMSACLETALIFIWRPFFSNCANFQYAVTTSSSCGTCPTVSVQDSITCIGAPLDGTTCTIAIQTEVCGSIRVSNSQSLSIDPTCPHSDTKENTILVTLLGVCLAISLVVCIAMCVVFAMWRYKKLKEADDVDLQQERNPNYEDVTRDTVSQPNIGHACLTQNIAYGYTIKPPIISS